MWQDGRNFVERRLTPRIKMTARRHIAYWVAMSPARRAIASLGVAAIIGGATFGACRASDVTAPSFKSQAPGASRSLTLDDSDSDTPSHQANHKRMSDDEAKNDPGFVTTVETRFPVTEAVYNTCTNEGPIVLTGDLKIRMQIINEPLGSLKFKLHEWKDTRGVYGTIEVDEDGDGDLELVKYTNKESLLDKFEVGPADAPFKSLFQAKMHLQRHGDKPDHVWKHGDDLFVYVFEYVKIDTNGQVVVKTEFKTDCK